MEIKEIEEKDKGELIGVYLSAVLMPNGELIRYGKSLGFTKENKGIYIKK